MNPCQCGYWTAIVKRCAPTEATIRFKVNGPLLVDDLFMAVQKWA